MRDVKLSALCAGVVAAGIWMIPAAGFAEPPAAPSTPAPATQPHQVVPEKMDPGMSGSSSGSLSHRLDQSGGVIRPPAGVDPGLDQAPPALGQHSMPVIPPPGTPGGNPEIKPK